jgi:phage baseplate assembly protein W
MALNESGTPVGIKIPYSRGKTDGFFAQTYSMLERAEYNLTMLLLTAKGERPMMPEYGSNLRSILFDPNSEQHLADIFEDEIKETVNFWMPEVEITYVHTEIPDSPLDKNKVSLRINYELASVPNVERELELLVE